MLLRAEALVRQIGTRRLFADVSFEVHPRDRLALVGPNGAGKTTLLRILSGDEAPDAGRVVRPRGVRAARLRQEMDPTLEHPVREEVASALGHLDALEREWRELERRFESLGREGREPPAELAARYDELRARFEADDGFRRDARVERVLSGLGFDPDASARPVRSFSGGWLVRIELAKLLLSEPDVLLLDEPTNHLDLPAIEWLEEFLAGWGGAVVAVSHDRTFLRRHAARVAELESGRLEVYAGGFDRYREERAARRASADASRRSEARRRAELERFVERFRAKATKARQAQSRLKMLERMEREATPAPAPAPRRLRLRIPPPARVSDVVVELAGVEQGYGATRVYRDLDLSIRRGDRVALVGPNGAGKSTLLRIVSGRVAIEGGQRRLGHGVHAAHYAQHQLEALDPQGTVLGELERAARSEDLPRLRGHLGALLFSGDDVAKPVSVLSGGEKARLALARMLLRPAPLLVMDEPTNHLDAEACEVLEQALAGWEGTLLFVSHDRAFVNAVATRVIEVRGGRLREFAGNYDDYLRQAAGAAAGDGARAGSRSAAPDAVPPRADRDPRRAARDRRRAAERAARALATLEDRILERERALEALAWRMAEPAVHRDGERMRAFEEERTSLRLEIDALYREWESCAGELEEAQDARAAGEAG